MCRWCRTYFLFLEGVGCILLMSLGLAVAPRQSTPPGVARARGALRDRGREGTIVARGGAEVLVKTLQKF